MFIKNINNKILKFISTVLIVTISIISLESYLHIHYSKISLTGYELKCVSNKFLIRKELIPEKSENNSEYRPTINLSSYSAKDKYTCPICQFINNLQLYILFSQTHINAIKKYSQQGTSLSEDILLNELILTGIRAPPFLQHFLN